jgi:hypothetical protein
VASYFYLCLYLGHVAITNLCMCINSLSIIYLCIYYILCISHYWKEKLLARLVMWGLTLTRQVEAVAEGAHGRVTTGTQGTQGLSTLKHAHNRGGELSQSVMAYLGLHTRPTRFGKVAPVE